MTEELKQRTCLKCKQKKTMDNFPFSNCRFLPNHHALLCFDCLEAMINEEDLNDVDALMRHLDVPFDLNLWTKLQATHGGRTLQVYFNAIADEHYAATSWSDENTRWLMAKREQTIDEEIEALSENKMRQLRKTWSPAYTKDELLFLDDYYNQIVATQNVSTPILQHYARDLCEIELRIKKGLREGADIKKDMDARDNIIKIAHFEATNAKNAADFESVGELMVYYGKKGWHPKWHQEPKDSIDFLMENIQNYLKRLVINEGNFAEQVEDKRTRYNLTERLDTIENESVNDDALHEIDYVDDNLGDDFRE